MRSGNCVCIALYDWLADLSAPAFYDIARSFFAASNVVPDCGGIDLGGSGNSRTLKHSTIASRLKKPEYAQATSVELYHTIPNYAQLVFGWDVTVGYHADKHRDMYFCAGVELTQLGMDYMANLVERISHLTNLTYGIGYTRAFRDGPDLYALGMATNSEYSPEGMRAADRVGAWFRERIGQNRHRQGYLRDVYTLNVISQPHLEMPVHGTPLGEWIGQTPHRGTLRPLAGGAWLWRVDDAQVPCVQAQLEAAGLLIAHLGSTRR
jgi:hypothetical protein